MSRRLHGPLRDVPNDTGLASDPLTVHVKNVPDVYMSEESLEMLFESKTFNHVPSVKKVVLLGNNEATVTFDYPDDASFVLQKHRLQPCELKGQMLTILPIGPVTKPALGKQYSDECHRPIDTRISYDDLQNGSDDFDSIKMNEWDVKSPGPKYPALRRDLRSEGIETTYEASKEVVSEMVSIRLFKGKYLKKSGFDKHTHAVRMEYCEKAPNMEITLTGKKKDVDECTLKIYTEIEDIESKRIVLEPERTRLLKRVDIQKAVTKEMNMKNLTDIWEIYEDSVIMYTKERDDFKMMEHIIVHAVSKVVATLDKHSLEAIFSEKWKTVEKGLRSKCKDCLEIRIDDMKLCIFTTPTMEDEVHDSVEEFRSKNAVYTEILSADASRAKFMKKHMDTEMSQIRKSVAKIDIHSNGCIEIEGTSASIKPAKKALIALVDKLLAEAHEIEKLNIKQYFSCNKGMECIQKAESHGPCVIEIRIGKSEGREMTLTPCAEVDVIVNSASADLKLNSKVHFTIYSSSKDGIKRAIKSIDQTIKDEWQIASISDCRPILHNKQIKELEMHAANNHVAFTVDHREGKICIIGLIVNVSNMEDQVHIMLRNADKYKHEQENAELLQSVVQWVFIKGTKTVAFDKPTNQIIEQAFAQKQKSVLFKVGRSDFKIDFDKMKEYDVKCPGTKYPVLRRDLRNVKETKLDIPSQWSAMKDPAHVESITLSKSDKEYVQVEKEFSKSIGQGVHITQIERIQNATLYTQYQAKKKQMQTSCKTKNVEHTLWHGTAHAACKSITAHGFNRSYCGKNATAFGQGVYFAVSAKYSAQPTYSPPDSAGHKRMYRCLVLTGDCTRGDSSMRVPPPKNPTVPHSLYDSVSDNPGSPRMFVIFNDTQAYPEHLITFK